MNLLELIGEKRQQMIELGLKKGLTHEDTILCSQVLDSLLTLYQKTAITQTEIIA
ncbi:MAG TPA: aspartyl-phosphate phosphatase Spo0E family protein [Candidatus Angelobacter sp.]|nr:aspartyl-phosphate phosphatase Spo0E family protein [Candidatus Angelobacter sp.]